MKKLPYLRLLLFTSVIAFGATVRADEAVTNRLTLSARLGFNVSATFGPRLNRWGNAYNHYNGYALTDISGNAGGQTWYWGYDNSAQQISGNNILMMRPNDRGNLSSPSIDSDPNLGAELAYNRLLWVKGKTRIGLEAAVNYMALDLQDNTSRSIAGAVDAYGFTEGTTPPAATPSAPYQGSFKGPGFVINVPPVSTAANIHESGNWHVDDNAWGFRLGPYLEFPLSTNLTVSLSGGGALVLLEGTASWSETVSVPGSGTTSSSGSGDSSEMLWGGYVSANVIWRFAHDWSLAGGVQYQSVGSSEKLLGGRKVNVDLSNSIFVTLGLSYNF